MEAFGPYFHKIDTDRDQKIDVLEVLCACICLAKIPNEAKVDRLWTLFDFQKMNRLQPAELCLLFQSLSRGLGKACKQSTTLSPDDVNSIVETLYDASNIPSTEQVPRDQFTKWVQSDTSAQKFAEHITKCVLLMKGPYTKREAWSALTTEKSLPVEEYATLVAIAPNLHLPPIWDHEKLTLQLFMNATNT